MVTLKVPTRETKAAAFTCVEHTQLSTVIPEKRSSFGMLCKLHADPGKGRDISNLSETPDNTCERFLWRQTQTLPPRRNLPSLLGCRMRSAGLFSRHRPDAERQISAPESPSGPLLCSPLSGTKFTRVTCYTLGLSGGVVLTPEQEPAFKVTRQVSY